VADKFKAALDLQTLDHTANKRKPDAQSKHPPQNINLKRFTPNEFG
jgi:hypothetical protein